MNPVLDPLFARARSEPDAHLCTFVSDAGEETRHTVGSMAARIDRIAAYLLRDCGLTPGTRALLLYAPSMAFFEVYAACLRAGIVPCPAYPPDPLRPGAQLALLRAICEAAGVRTILTTRAYRRMVQLGNVGGLLTRRADAWPDVAWIATDAADRFQGTAVFPSVSADTVALLQFTSGSTSTPRGVRLTFGNLAHQLAMCREQLGFSAESRLVMWVPPYHDLGLVSGMTAVLGGLGQLFFLSPTTFLRDPGAWFDAVHRYRGTHTASPNFGFALAARKLDAERIGRWDLSCLQVVMSAAEPIVPATMDRFFQAFAPAKLAPTTFRPAYGLAEHTVGVTIGRGARLQIVRERALREQLATPDPDGDWELVGCGAPTGDVRVAIVVDGRRVSEGRIGEIWVSSPSVADGYEGSRAGFDAALDLPGRWLRTGDFGFLHAGELYVTGRMKDLVILRGKKLHPEDLEEAVRGCHPDVRPGGIAAFSVPGAASETLALVVEVTDTRDASGIIAAIQQRLGEVFGVRGEIALVGAHTVPKTTSGKVRRQATRERWLSGAIQPLQHAPLRQTDRVSEAPLRPQLDGVDPEERVAWLGAALMLLVEAKASVQVPPGFPADGALRDAGIDSAVAADLIAAIEGWADTRLPMSVLEDRPTFLSLAEAVLVAMGVPHAPRPTVTAPRLLPHPARPPHRPIAPDARVLIVGAGVAGLSCADTLVRLGFSRITVLEASEQVGGKIATARVDGSVVELGLMYAVSTERELLELISRHGLTTTLTAGRETRWGEAGIVPGPARGPGMTWIQRVLRAAKQPQTTEVPLPSPTLDEPFTAFVERHKLGVHPWFRAVWDAMGYGVEASGPTSSVVAYLQVLGGAMAMSQVDGGNDLLCQRLADELRDRWGVRLRTGTPALAITPGEVVRVQTPSGWEEYDEVIVTLPPGPLARALPADAPVQPLLQRFRWYDYVTFAVRVEGLPEPLVLTTAQSRPGRLISAQSFTNGWHCVATWLGGPGIEGTYTLDEAKAAITEDLTALGGRVLAFGPHRRWDYFPHDPERAAATIHDVERLQGVGHVWYAGAFVSFDMSEHVIRHARHLMRTGFDPAFEEEP